VAKRMAVLRPLLPVLVAGPLDPLRHHVHGAIQRDRLPGRPARPSIQDRRGAMGPGHQLERGGALRTEAPLGDGRVGIALDVGDPVPSFHQLFENQQIVESPRERSSPRSSVNRASSVYERRPPSTLSWRHCQASRMSRQQLDAVPHGLASNQLARHIHVDNHERRNQMSPVRKSTKRSTAAKKAARGRLR
jgi:hypothetical protein